jgi:hypothetical protein
MATGRRTWAYSLAALGSAALTVSLWLPWYTFRLPTAIIDQAQQLAQQFGVLGPLIKQSADLVRSLGPIHLNAWQVFSQTDIVLVVAGAAAGGMALLTYTGRAAGVARLIAACGGLALALAAYRLASPPGPSGMLQPAWGGYVALVGAATVLVAGLLANAGEADRAASPPDLTVLDPSGPWPTTVHSVAPPGSG